MNAEELLAEVRELVISVGGPHGGSLAVMISDILGITEDDLVYECGEDCECDGCLYPDEIDPDDGVWDEENL